MSDSRFVSESIEEMLVALAAGVREAQEALNEIAPVDAFGRPMPTYHIPYLDFEIAVEVETQQQEDGRAIFRLRKIPTGTATKRVSETRSTISGRLVSVPPGEGLPIPSIHITADAEGAREHRIEIVLSNSAGELLAGRRIELNIDRAASAQLSRANGGAFDKPKAGTHLVDAVLVTDEEGTARTRMSIDSGENAKALIVVTAQSGATSASLSLPARSGQ